MLFDISERKCLCTYPSGMYFHTQIRLFTHHSRPWILFLFSQCWSSFICINDYTYSTSFLLEMWPLLPKKNKTRTRSYITAYFTSKPLPWVSVHWLVLECQWNAIGRPSVHWNTTGRPSEYLQGHWNTTGKKHSWNCPILECDWRNWLLNPTLEHHWRDCNSPPTPRQI